MPLVSIKETYQEFGFRNVAVLRNKRRSHDDFPKPLGSRKSQNTTELLYDKDELAAWCKKYWDTVNINKVIGATHAYFEPCVDEYLKNPAFDHQLADWFLMKRLNISQEIAAIVAARKKQ